MFMQRSSSLESLMVRSFARNRYRPHPNPKTAEYQSGWFPDGNPYGFDVLIDNPVYFSEDLPRALVYFRRLRLPGINLPGESMKSLEGESGGRHRGHHTPHVAPSTASRSVENRRHVT